MSLKLVATTKCKIKMTANGVESLPVELSDVMSFSGTSAGIVWQASITVTINKSNYSSVDNNSILINKLSFNVNSITYTVSGVTYAGPIPPTPSPVADVNSTTIYSTDSDYGILRVNDRGLVTVTVQDPITQTTIPVNITFEIVDAGQTSTTAE